MTATVNYKRAKKTIKIAKVNKAERELVRFDWAMKKLLRNKSNFAILEGFFSELLRRDVKVKEILESESNRENAFDKNNRVDLLAKEKNGDLFLIELQVEGQSDFFHRMLYGSSKLVTQFIDKGAKYGKIRKVISVNIVYFDLGHGRDYVYRGTTEFKGIHHHDILGLTAEQKKKIKNVETVADIFPEYYILKVNRFGDRTKDTLDEWIYFLKNSKIKRGFKAKGLKKAAQELDYLNLPEIERKRYERYMESQMIAESVYETALDKGYYKGYDAGMKKGIDTIAQAMKNAGIADKIIEKVIDTDKSFSKGKKQ